MNYKDKTKEQLIIELQELQQKHDSLKASIEIGFGDKQNENLLLEKLIGASEEFIQFTADKPDYDKILQIMLDISGAKFATLNIFDNNGLDFTSVALAGIKENIKIGLSILGFDIINKHWKHDPLRAEKTKHYTINRFEYLHELTGNAVSKSIIYLIEKTFNIQETFVVKIVKDNKVLGDFTLIYNKGETMKNNKFVDLYAHQVGMFLDGNRITGSLRISEAKHSSMIANISDVIGIIGADGFMKYNSPNIEKYFGWKPDDLIGTNGWLTVHPDDLERIQKEFLTLLENDNSTRTVEYQYKCKNGTFKPIKLTATNLVNDPIIGGILMNCRDITDRKQDELDIRESEEKYRLLYSSMDQGLALHEIIVDDSGNPVDFIFLDINDSYTRIFGVTREMSIGKRIREVMPKLEQYWIDIFGKVALTGESCYYENYIETTGKYYSTYSYCPKKNQFAVLVSDITERKKAEKAIKESEEKFRNLVWDMQVGVLLQGPRAEILLSNPKALELLGISEDQLLGKSSFDPDWNVIHEDGSPFPEDTHPVPQAISSRCAVNNVIMGVYRPKMGDRVWLMVDAQPQLNNDGEVVHVVCSFMDITGRKQAENELQEKDVQYNNLANCGLALIWTAGLDKQCNYFNDPWLQFTGRSLEQEIGDGWTEGVHPDDFDNCLETYVAAFDKRESFNMEYRLRHVSGEFRWLLDKGTPNYNTNGEFIGYIGHCFDISESKKAEQELFEAKEILVESEYQLKERVKELNGIFALGLLAEKYFATSFGYSFPLEDIYNEFVSVVVPKSLQFSGEVYVSLKIGDKEYCNIQDIQLPENRKYLSAQINIFGKQIGELYVSYLQDLPFIDFFEQNLIKAYSERISKIIERDNIQQELVAAKEKAEESEEKFRSLSENSQDYIMRYDKHHRHTYMNKAGIDITGGNAGILIGKTHKEAGIFDEKQCEFWETKIETVFKTKQAYSEQFSFEGTNGNIHLDWRLFPEFNDKNEVVSVLGVSRDITYIKQAELKLQQLNADKDRFISILGHDLKSPFSSILGFLKLLIKNIRKYDIDKIEELLNIVNNNAKNTYNLLEDILLWASLQTDKMLFEPKKLNFKIICTEVIDVLKPNANSKNITINHFAAQEILILADANMLKTILRNLVSNAIKFSNPGGIINIYAEHNQTDVTISVSDNGVGIALDILTKLFDLTQKITCPGTADEKGTGLGLLLCKEFVEKHGGKIWAESEVGKGSTFYFLLNENQNDYEKKK